MTDWHLALLVLAGAAALGCGARSSLEGESLGDGGSGTTTTDTTTTTTSTSTTTSTTTTSTTTTLDEIGCADGAREGFLAIGTYPAIAACSGGFHVPGLLGGLSAKCGLGGGDDGPNPDGVGCSAADLCATGWHVCASAAEVAALSPTGCAGSAPAGGLFFATRQSSPGCGLCAMGSVAAPGCGACECVSDCLQTDLTSNDVFGCGSLGAVPDDCGVLDRFSNNNCGSLSPPWSCTSDGCTEAHAVTKPGPSAGGVLCCRD